MAWAAVQTASSSFVKKVLHNEPGLVGQEDQVELSPLATPRHSKVVKTNKRQDTADEELEEYKQIFNEFDKDHSGFISAVELGEATKTMAMDYSTNDLEKIVEEVDQDGNGLIDFDEFCIVLKRMTAKNSWDEIIKQCFEVFDQSGSGVINESDFRRILYNLGGIHDESLIESLFEEYDVDSNGLIEFEEFSNFVRAYLTDDDVDG